MKTNRLFIFVLLVAMLPIMLSGCFSFLNPVKDGGNLQVKINIPQEYLAEMHSQFVNYDISIASILVTVSKGGTSFAQNAVLTGNSAIVNFSALQTGVWDVSVAANDLDGYTIFAGSGTGTVSTQANMTSNVELKLLKGSLSVNVSLPLGVVSGKVTLVNPANPALNIVKDLVISGGSGTADFGEMTATTYPLVVELYDAMGTQVYYGQEALDVLPGRSTYVSVTMDVSGQGNLGIVITWELIPAAPTGVSAVRQGANVKVSWTANTEPGIIGYMVYRSTGTTGKKLLLTTTLVNGTEYMDAGVPEGADYYYWIMAYNSKGYSSKLSEPVAIGAGIGANADLIIFCYDPGEGDMELFTVHATGLGQTRLTNDTMSQWFGVWSPDRTKIIFEANNGVNFDIYMINADGTGLTNLTNTPQDEYCPAWSPDGTKIVFDVYNSTNTDICIMNADGTNRYQLTFNAATERNGIWSPDGTKIAYLFEGNGSSDLYVMNPDGSGQTNLTNTPGIWEASHSWSPNSNKIMYTIDGNIYIFNLSTYTSQQLTYTVEYEYCPSWSPDGTKIAFEGQRAGTSTYEICTMNADGTGLQYLTSDMSDDRSPCWSPDGTRLSYLTWQFNGTSPEIMVTNADGTGQVRLTTNTYTESCPVWKNYY